MSSGWFDHTEPSLSGVQGAYALVRGVSSTSNLVPEPHHYRDSKVCRVLSHIAYSILYCYIAYTETNYNIPGVYSIDRNKLKHSKWSIREGGRTGHVTLYECNESYPEPCKFTDLAGLLHM